MIIARCVLVLPSGPNPLGSVGVRRAKAGLPLSRRHRLVTQWLRASFHELCNPLRNEFV